MKRGISMSLASFVVVLGTLQTAVPTSASTSTPPTAETAKKVRTIRVFAASSLSPVADQLASAYTKKTGVPVELQLGGSAGLATRIENGDSADVFISADEANMYRLVSTKRAKKSTPIATSSLSLLVSKASRVPITKLADLANEDIVLAVGGQGIPIGDYTAQCFSKAGITVKADTEESNVRAIVSKVELGEVDAGVVYRTDTFDSTKAIRIPIPAKFNVKTTLVASAIVQDGKPSARGISFVAFLRSSTATSLLKRRGFGIPA